MLSVLKASVSQREIVRIINFEEHDPAAILGPHMIKIAGKTILSIRVFVPRASKAWVQLHDQEVRSEMIRIHPAGFFEAQFLDQKLSIPYSIVFTDNSGYSEEREDPYSYNPMLSDLDLYLMGEGTHVRSYEKLGSHLINRDGIEGVQFAVWAPNAGSVCVVGDFNHWKLGAHPMIVRGNSGIWELFIPRMGESEVYKFGIKSNTTGKTSLKTDPYAFQTELRPRTGAIVGRLDSYKWHNDEWMVRRGKGTPFDKPISIYEVHLGSWRKKGNNSSEFLNYRELADELVPYVKEIGFTHIELMPIMEHPLDDSWGYQVVNYYAPTSRHGRPQDLMYLIDKCHQNDIGVILDWVPAHFPKDDYGLADFDGTPLYNPADSRVGEHREWGTLVFNYSRNEVRAFLVSNALFWLDKYRVDGLRIDAVASMLYLDYARKNGEWIPNKYGGKENLEAIAFLRYLNETVHSLYPNVLVIAEESTAWTGVSRSTNTGGLGFDLKWNMGWMHDTLEYFSKDPIYRKHHQSELTFSMIYAFTENFVLVLSHDEVVYGKKSMLNKMPGDDWQKFANLRLCYGYMFAHPGKKLMFMGDEFGQWDEWNFRKSLDWDLLKQTTHRQLLEYVKQLNQLYSRHDALHKFDFSPEGFEWIDFSDWEQSVVIFLRKGKKSEDLLLVACNFTSVPRVNYRMGVPRKGLWKEVLNSDAKEYGGSGLRNLGGMEAASVPFHGRNYSISLTLPPLGIVFLVNE